MKKILMITIAATFFSMSLIAQVGTGVTLSTNSGGPDSFTVPAGDTYILTSYGWISGTASTSISIQSPGGAVVVFDNGSLHPSQLIMDAKIYCEPGSRVTITGNQVFATLVKIVD